MVFVVSLGLLLASGPVDAQEGRPTAPLTHTVMGGAGGDRPLAPSGASEPAESPPRTHVEDRRWPAAAALGGVYAGLAIWAYFAWYHGKADLPAFKVGGDHLFGVNTYAGGADKVGHFAINYVLARAGAAALRWGGWRPLPASLIGAGLSWGFFAFVEIKDGFYYELSLGDLAGNTLGAATGVLFEAWPALDRLMDFRVAYWPSARFRRELVDEGNVDVAEDYSGLSYLLALHLSELPGIRGGAAAPYLALVDVTGGFQTRGYKPDPAPGEARGERSQEVYLGLSLNLQGLIDGALLGRGGVAESFRKAGHGVFEVTQLPFTTLPLVSGSRTRMD